MTEQPELVRCSSTVSLTQPHEGLYRCELAAGHDGLHHADTEIGPVYWAYDWMYDWRGGSGKKDSE